MGVLVLNEQIKRLRVATLGADPHDLHHRLVLKVPVVNGLVRRLYHTSDEKVVGRPGIAGNSPLILWSRITTKGEPELVPRRVDVRNERTSTSPGSPGVRLERDGRDDPRPDAHDRVLVRRLALRDRDELVARLITAPEEEASVLPRGVRHLERVEVRVVDPLDALTSRPTPSGQGVVEHDRDGLRLH